MLPHRKASAKIEVLIVQRCPAEQSVSVAFERVYNGIMDNKEDKIRDVVKSFYEAFNSHNFESAEQYTTSHWIHVNPLGGWSEGRDAVMDKLKQVHSKNPLSCFVLEFACTRHAHARLRRCR